MNRSRFEVDAARGATHECSFDEIEVDEMTAVFTESVIVAFGDAIISGSSIAKSDLADESRFLEVMERVIDGGIADGREFLARCGKDVIRCGVRITVAHDLEDDTPLRRQPFFQTQLLSSASVDNPWTHIKT